MKEWVLKEAKSKYRGQNIDSTVCAEPEGSSVWLEDGVLTRGRHAVRRQTW